jgi:hypothetical protein
MFLVALLALAVALPSHPVSPRPRDSRPEAPSADSSALFFARARDLARAGRPAEALLAYQQAAIRADGPEDWARIRRDLAWIAAPKELTVWDHASPATRPALTLAFWSERDHRDSLESGGRLAEHVRRVDVAMARYRISPKRGRAPMMRVSSAAPLTNSAYEIGLTSPLRDYVPGQGEIDDRGVIFIRQGEPTARRFTGTTAMESWVYERDGKPLVVHFADALFDGSSGATMLVAAPSVGTLHALCDLDNSLCGPFGSLDQQERRRQRALATIRELTSTDHGPRVER